MVIIVSEDGWIDVLPTPKRRVRRATVAQAVQRLVAAADEGTSQERFARLDNALERLEFYLDAAQCEAVNDARERVEQRRWEEHRTRRPGGAGAAAPGDGRELLPRAGRLRARRSRPGACTAPGSYLRTQVA